MKQSWEIKTLGDISEILNGGTPDTTVPKFWDGENLWITPKDMGKLESIYVDDTLRKITNEGLKNSSAKILPPNSIILSSRAPIGHLAINTKPISTNQGCKGLVPKKGVNTLFLYYFLSKSVDLLNSLGTGATFKELSGSKLGTVPIPLPPLPEQQRIVAILDEAFSAIAKAKANAEQNLKNAKELFESYLQGVFENKGEGWEEKTLKEISLEFARGKSKHRPRGDASLLNGKYPLIQTGDISNANHWINEYSQTYNEKGLAQSKLWSKGTICIAIVGANVAETAILNFDACFPDSVIGIVVNPAKANNEYVDYLLQTFKTYLKEKGKGTARDNINLGTFESQRFPFPSLKKQIEIVQKLDALSAETKKLEAIYQQKINDLEELKKSVLQKAFSGELRSPKGAAYTSDVATPIAKKKTITSPERA